MRAITICAPTSLLRLTTTRLMTRRSKVHVDARRPARLNAVASMSLRRGASGRWPLKQLYHRDRPSEARARSSFYWVRFFRSRARLLVFLANTLCIAALQPERPGIQSGQPLLTASQARAQLKCLGGSREAARRRLPAGKSSATRPSSRRARRQRPGRPSSGATRPRRSRANNAAATAR